MFSNPRVTLAPSFRYDAIASYGQAAQAKEPRLGGTGPNGAPADWHQRRTSSIRISFTGREAPGRAGERSTLEQNRSGLAVTIQLGAKRLLDLFAQGLRRSALTDSSRICARLTPRGTWRASPCAKICGAIAALPTEWLRLRAFATLNMYFCRDISAPHRFECERAICRR
jgi:hypothetical protein